MARKKVIDECPDCEYWDYSDFGYGSYGMAVKRRYEQPAIWNMDAILDTYTNWNSPQADKERTIFGRKEEGLFYNYSDRLDGWDYEKARRAREYASLVSSDHRTATYMTAMLSYFHDGAKVELRHVIAGCNRSNGYPYLIYGYKYQSKVEDAERLFQYDEIRTNQVKVLEEAKAEFTGKFDEAIAEVLENSKPKNEPQ